MRLATNQPVFERLVLVLVDFGPPCLLDCGFCSLLPIGKSFCDPGEVLSIVSDSYE